MKDEGDVVRNLWQGVVCCCQPLAFAGAESGRLRARSLAEELALALALAPCPTL